MGNEHGELGIEVKPLPDAGSKDTREAEPAASGGAARPRRGDAVSP